MIEGVFASTDPCGRHKGIRVLWVATPLAPAPAIPHDSSFQLPLLGANVCGSPAQTQVKILVSWLHLTEIHQVQWSGRFSTV